MTRAQHDFPTQLPQLEPIRDWICDWCEKEELDDSVTQRLSLVAEELFLNLVNYGNAATGSQARFALYPDGPSVCLEMIDSGGAFDPFAAQTPPSPDSMLGRGGLGLYLVRNFAEKAEYSRDAGHNRSRVWLARQKDDTPLRSSI